MIACLRACLLTLFRSYSFVFLFLSFFLSLSLSLSYSVWFCVCLAVFSVYIRVSRSVSALFSLFLLVLPLLSFLSSISISVLFSSSPHPCVSLSSCAVSPGRSLLSSFVSAICWWQARFIWCVEVVVFVFDSRRDAECDPVQNLDLGSYNSTVETLPWFLHVLASRLDVRRRRCQHHIPPLTQCIPASNETVIITSLVLKASARAETCVPGVPGVRAVFLGRCLLTLWRASVCVRLQVRVPCSWGPLHTISARLSDTDTGHGRGHGTRGHGTRDTGHGTRPWTRTPTPTWTGAGTGTRHAAAGLRWRKSSPPATYV